MEIALLLCALVAGLLLIPFGLPGLWLMVGAALLYSYAAPNRLGIVTILGLTVLALVAEVLEFVLAGRYARKFGGSKRAGWGAIVGGIVGAVVGVPLPVVGSMIGAFVGAFAGAFVAELTIGTNRKAATRVATGALIGRIVSVAMKVAVGLVLIVWVAGALLLSGAR
ncbi:MAG: DUF456 domain-containing protein [Anaerolineae bacterium]|nr:DUF456 domain-containing protein [Gemmatimonadaceae bacterium]